MKEADEFLSGMTKTDRILPVINLVVYYGEKAWDGPRSLSDMMNVPPLFSPLFNDQKLQLLEVRNTGNMKFENPDNRDFFSMIEEFYTNNGHINLEDFKKKYPGKEVWWETLAAIGAATGSEELIEYAQEHKGGRLNMCTALENLKQEGRQEGILQGQQEGMVKGMVKGMVAAYRELNISDDAIILKLQEKFSISYKDATQILKNM